VLSLRRQSKGNHKTSSLYRGVTRHQKGKWEARIGQMIGRKYKCALHGNTFCLLECMGSQRWCRCQAEAMHHWIQAAKYIGQTVSYSFSVMMPCTRLICHA
jgi:hypothetical protein